MIFKSIGIGEEAKCIPSQWVIGEERRDAAEHLRKKIIHQKRLCTKQSPSPVKVFLMNSVFNNESEK